MRFFFKFSIIFMFFLGCQNGNVVDFNKISINDSIAYFENKKFSGAAAIFDSTNNIVAEYFFEQGILFKQCYLDTVDSCWIEEKIVKGLCEGHSKVIWKDGKVSFLHYSKGFLDGVQKTYSKDDKLILYKTYKLGKLHGKFMEFNGNGDTLISGSYYNNLRDSIWTLSDTTNKNYVLYEKGMKVSNLSNEVINYGKHDTSWIEAFVTKEDTIMYEIDFHNRELVKFHRFYK